jgi:hypothetical protein
MDFARVKMKLVRVKQPQVMTALPVKVTRAPVLKATQQAESPAQRMHRAQVLKASQPVELRRVLENQRQRVNLRQQETLALVAQQLDQPAPAFASPAPQRSVASRD